MKLIISILWDLVILTSFYFQIVQERPIQMSSVLHIDEV